jgi:hypothetical protein
MPNKTKKTKVKVIKSILVQNADTLQNYLIHYANAAVKQNTKDQDVKFTKWI